MSEKATKLKDTLNQFMQVSMAIHKNTEASTKNLEVQVGQLVKQFSDIPSNTLSANTPNNPKENYNFVFMDDKIVVKAKQEK